MSLIKMLSVARSLLGERDLLHPYRVVQENLMPNFSRSGSRPVLIAEEPNGTGASRVRSFSEGESVELVSDGKATMRWEKGQVMNEQQKEMFGTVPQGAEVSRGQRQRARWVGNPFFPRPTLRADSKGQLSLEFVKVVRNDLGDSDLELVPAKVRSNPTPAPSSVPAVSTARSESLEPEPSRWSRFTARLFRAGTPS